MISPNVLSCRPKVRTHTFMPSEDDPKELILIASGNGAALGISHAEKQLVDLMTGDYSMADIIERIIHDRLASLLTLRHLVWDLYRYGLLDNSPWEIENAMDGWGYWGKYDSSRSQFWIVPLLGSLEPILGRILVSPFFHMASFLLVAASVWQWGSLFHALDPLRIGNSVALGFLVVLVSILGGACFTLWMGAMVLRAAYPSPVRCASDYRYALPVLCLDGRRLRAFPTRKALHYAVSPLVGLLALSSLFLLGAGIGDGVRREGLLHVCGSLWLTALILAIPWNSTLISREVLLRIREESVFALMVRAVRRAFHYVFQNRLADEPHDKLCLMWGIWTVLGSLLLIRLAAYLLRWEFPILVNLFLAEKNRPLLIALIALLGILTAALIATLLSFFYWLGCEIVREIRNRYWPERDRAIVGLLGLAALFVLTQYFWTLREGTVFTSHLPLACCGLLLTILSFRSWRLDGTGLEPLIHLLPFSWGVLLLIHAFGFLDSPRMDWHSETNPSHFFLLFNQPVPTYRVWFCNLILAVGITYWIALWRFCFRPISPIRENLGKKIGLTIVAIGLWIGFNFLALFPAGLAGAMSQVLFGGFFASASLFSIWIGSLLNGSSAVLCVGSFLIDLGFLRPDRHAPVLGGTFLICAGTFVSLAGLILRSSAKIKIALFSSEPSSPESVREPWSLKRLAHVWKIARLELFQVDLRLPVPNEITEDTMRDYLNQMHRLVGTNCLYALLRRLACTAPWYATRNWIKILPASVPAPRLTDWTPERIERGLRSVPTFANLDRFEMAALVSRTRIAIYKPGERLIHQGRQEGCLYAIAQGTLSVEREHPFGNRVIAVLSTGDFVGEIGFLSGMERTASVRAMTPSLLLCIHRNDIDESIPTILATIEQSESGNSWIKAFSQSTVFKEFPPSLSARICLESRLIAMERGDSLWLESPDLAENVAVFLLGKGCMITEGEITPVVEGTLVGLEACLADCPMKGIIRAETPSFVMIVDRTLFREALAEILTPVYVLESNSEPSTAK